MRKQAPPYNNNDNNSSSSNNNNNNSSNNYNDNDYKKDKGTKLLKQQPKMRIDKLAYTETNKPTNKGSILQVPTKSSSYSKHQNKNNKISATSKAFVALCFGRLLLAPPEARFVNLPPRPAKASVTCRQPPRSNPIQLHSSSERCCFQMCTSFCAFVGLAFAWLRL